MHAVSSLRADSRIFDRRSFSLLSFPIRHILCEPIGTQSQRFFVRSGVMKVFAMVLGLVAICGIAMAQDAAANRASPSAQKLDEHIGACLTLANQNEIALAKLAQEKSTNEEVKNLARD